jgi:hypothetical protein
MFTDGWGSFTVSKTELATSVEDMHRSTRRGVDRAETSPSQSASQSVCRLVCRSVGWSVGLSGGGLAGGDLWGRELDRGGDLLRR